MVLTGFGWLSEPQTTRYFPKPHLTSPPRTTNTIQRQISAVPRSHVFRQNWKEEPLGHRRRRVARVHHPSPQKRGAEERYE
ncbi:predicted protein [Histoplasma capsulatum H143]|uniref:Uncharacterized protein n=1 Tax=Ajellomyces capsulatus (strain H143) TaxID=544712 RepID=C6H6I4_AJECH|nr:predicted protein [Histoplasma capsulatum H143]